MKSLKTYQELVDAELKKLQLPNNPSELYAPITYTLNLGGKRIRPALLLAAASLFGSKENEALNPAMGIEVFHNFTLLHDDIMDNAPIRRNQPTVHEKWNVSTAILSGDAMFVKACQLMMDVDPSLMPRVLELFYKTALEVCEGQQIDMNFESAVKVSLAQYIRMIELKTAVLLGASLKIGALIGGAREEDAEALYQFGRYTGIAFQLQDDLMDVYADQGKFGKQTGGDIISNKKTYLLIRAMELANKYMSEELSYWLMAKDFNPEEKVSAVTGIYDFLGIKDLTEKEMNRYYEKGLAYLEKIPVGSEKKKVLFDFVDALALRQS